jgi:hypothetical protein
MPEQKKGALSAKTIGAYPGQIPDRARHGDGVALGNTTGGRTVTGAPRPASYFLNF